MESAVDCSEDGSVGTESERNEDWDVGSQQMDYGQEDIYEQQLLQQELFSGDPSRKILEALQLMLLEKKKLKENLTNQQGNIFELQVAYQNMASTLEQLPLARELAMKRYNDVLSDIQSVRAKQCCLNDMLEKTVEFYDRTIAVLHSARDRFDEQKRLNEERRVVIASDLHGLPEAGDAALNTIETAVRQKRECCRRLNRYLDDLNQLEVSMLTLNERSDLMFVTASGYNSEALELDCHLKTSHETKENLFKQLENASSDFKKSTDELNQKELEVSAEIAAVRMSLEKARSNLEAAMSSNDETKIQHSSSAEQLDVLNNQVSQLTVELQLLGENKANTDRQESEVLEILSEQKRRLDNVSLMQSEVQAMEAELNKQKRNIAEMEDACGQINMKIEGNERVMNAAMQATALMNDENEKLHQEIEAMQIANSQAKKKIETNELTISNDIDQTQTAINEMKLKLHLCFEEFHQYRIKYEELQNQKVSRRSAISEKHAETGGKQAFMNSITESLEEREVEWTRLNKKKRAALQQIDNAKKLNDELIDSRKELAHLEETFRRRCEELNESYNGKLKEKEMEIKNNKIENSAGLAELADEISKLEVEQLAMKTTHNIYSSLLEEAAGQTEIYLCEKSLHSTFAQLKTEEDRTERSVTSTSDHFVKHGYPNNEIEDFDFEVKQIRTTKRVPSNETTND